MVKVNGKFCEIAGLTIKEFILSTKYDVKRIAIELNGQIVFKSQYENVILKDGDDLEIVSFVGGG